MSDSNDEGGSVRRELFELMEIGRSGEASAVQRLLAAMKGDRPAHAAVAAVALWLYLEDYATSSISSSEWSELHEYARYSLLQNALTNRNDCYGEFVIADITREQSWQYRLACCVYLMEVGMVRVLRSLEDALSAGRVAFVEDGFVPSATYSRPDYAKAELQAAVERALKVAANRPEPRDVFEQMLQDIDSELEGW